MFIPLGTDRRLRRTPVVTRGLLILTAAAFIAQLVLGEGPFVLVPGQSGWWTLLTYAFLHDPTDMLHLVGNLVFLWVFGPAVEDRMGRIGFGIFYLFAAVAAGVVHAIVDGAPVFGASGAVSGVIGAFIALAPLTRIRTFIIFLFIGVWMVPAWVYIAVALGRDLLGFFSGGGGVAYAAHLGGQCFGFVLGMTLLATGLIKKDQYDLLALAKHAKRRQDIRDAARVSEKRIDQAMNKPEDPAEAAMRSVRAKVAEAVAAGDEQAACLTYAEVVAGKPQMATLPRDAQYRVAVWLYQRGDAELAAEAFGRFVETYPDDRETPEVTVLLARLRAGELNDGDGAKRLLESLLERVVPDEIRALARAELAAITGGAAS